MILDIFQKADTQNAHMKISKIPKNINIHLKELNFYLIIMNIVFHFLAIIKLEMQLLQLTQLVHLIAVLNMKLYMKD